MAQQHSSMDGEVVHALHEEQQYQDNSSDGNNKQ